jgi:hypothetical protein
MKRRPPAVATWLLETLGSDPRNDHIVGDLIEQYSLGRSRFWYWGQVAAAIVTGFFDQLRSHWLLALSALFAGWFAWLVLNTGLTAGLNALVNPWQTQLPTLAGLIWWTAWLANRAVSGWIIGRLYSKRRVAFVLLFSFSVFLWKAKIFQWPFYIDYEWPLRLVLNTSEDIRFLPALLSMILAPLFALLGGLFGATRDSRPAKSVIA